MGRSPDHPRIRQAFLECRQEIAGETYATHYLDGLRFADDDRPTVGGGPAPADCRPTPGQHQRRAANTACLRLGRARKRAWHLGAWVGGHAEVAARMPTSRAHASVRALLIKETKMGWELVVVEKAIQKIADQAIALLFDKLKEINNKLDLLIEKDFNTALDYLEEYTRCGSGDHKKECLNKAYEYFREAYGIKDLWMQVNAGFGMCICLLITNDRDEYGFRARQCIQNCNQLMVELIQEAYKFRVGQNIADLFAIEHAREEFDEFTRLADTLAVKSPLRSYTDWNIKLKYRMGQYPYVKPLNKNFLKILPYLDYAKINPVTQLRSKRYMIWKTKYFTCKNISEAMSTIGPP